jgi:hypothetical protein
LYTTDRYDYLPRSALILASMGGWVINRLFIPDIDFEPKGLPMKRCAVALFARSMGFG